MRSIDITNDINQSNSGFVAERKMFSIVHLKGIGRYCRRCNKKIEPTVFIRNQNGKKVKCVNYKNFCSNSCRAIFHDKRKSKMSKSSVTINIKLQKNLDGTRNAIVYLGNKTENIQVKLFDHESELWRVLEKIEKYRNLPKLEITV